MILRVIELVEGRRQGLCQDREELVEDRWQRRGTLNGYA